MEDLQEKNSIDNTINDNGSSQTKKNLKKTKKKEKKNYKDLKDLLDNIKKSKEKKSKTVKKKVKKKKDKTEEDKTEAKKESTPREKIIPVNNNIIVGEIEKEKTSENLENKPNTETPTINYIKKLSSTTSSSISHEDLNNGVQNNEEIPKNKHLNFIPKKFDDSTNQLMVNERDSNNSSLICNYFKEYEKDLMKTNKNIVELNDSINFVKKDIISSTKFNFNNDKFMINKSCNINSIDNINFFNYNSNLLYNNSNVNLNYNSNNKDSLNNVYYSNNLNINFYYNNIYLNNEENNNKIELNKNKSYYEINPENEINNSNMNNNININNNNLYINNFILQNAFSTEKKYVKKKSKLLKDISLFLQNSNSNFNLNEYNYYNTYENNNSTYNNYNKFNEDNHNKHKENFINNEYHQKTNNNINNIANNVENNIVAKKNNFNRRPNDWVCSRCFNLNFSFRAKCNRCGVSKDITIINNK